jgi:cell division septation protein DedD
VSGAGGVRGQGGRAAGRPAGRSNHWRALVLSVLFLAALPASRLAAQSSPLTTALRLAQDGHIDSARATLKRLLESTAPTDSLYPGVLYSSALVAPTAEEVRPLLQRVVVEYPVSTWAEPALIALAQLDYANGDPAGAARTLEKFRVDHATSNLYAVAAVWGARANLEANDTKAACEWVAAGLPRAGSDANARAELTALGRKCTAPAVQQASTAPASTVAVPPPDRKIETAVAAAPSPPIAAPRQPASAPPPAAPVTASAERPAAYTVQIVAANSQEVADEILARARSAGFKGVVVKDGGYFKVRLGEYSNRADASTAAARIKAKLGGSPFVVAP